MDCVVFLYGDPHDFNIHTCGNPSWSDAWRTKSPTHEMVKTLNFAIGIYGTVIRLQGHLYYFLAALIYAVSCKLVGTHP